MSTLNITTAALSHQEVEEALRKLKTNKAPGPDGAITEPFKFLDSENFASLTKCFNTLWNAKYVPDDFAFAYIASL